MVVNVEILTHPITNSIIKIFSGSILETMGYRMVRWVGSHDRKKTELKVGKIGPRYYCCDDPNPPTKIT